MHTRKDRRIGSGYMDQGGSIMLTTIMTIAGTAYVLGFLDMVLWNAEEGVLNLGR